MKRSTKKIIAFVIAMLIVLIFILLYTSGYILGPDKMWVKPGG